jgi:ABC-type spermidine/putrescine transport system permease subunit II
VILAFVLSASQVLGLYAFSSFLLFILGYIPTILVAALILVVTFLLADFVARLVSGSAKAANMPSGVASLVARYSIIVAGVISALAQLNIAAAGLLEIFFGGIVAALALALGLAFGLGGRDAAARCIEKMEDSWK